MPEAMDGIHFSRRAVRRTGAVLAIARILFHAA